MTNPQIAQTIWPILRKLARDQQTMTYGELATLVKHPARFLNAP